ncbi:MAG: fasciclin domain-containing protein [Planctomycetes bacterium]|nr:fasciclin domain-containing protein [Planctomycetota bacterium]
MKIQTILLALCTPALVATLPAQAQPAKQDIVSLAAGNAALSTLVTAVKAAGLVETLQGKGPFTVFAPTNAAFAKLPKGTVESLLKPANRQQLVEVLTAHVASKSLDASRALTAGSVATIEGTKFSLRLDGGQLFVGDAKVVINDIVASNGVVHVIDTVLMPERRISTPAEKARALIAFAVEQGAPLFNNGNADACASVYAVAVRALASNEALPATVRKLVETRSDSAAKEKSAASRAWALRAILDRCYEELEERAQRATAH